MMDSSGDDISGGLPRATRLKFVGEEELEKERKEREARGEEEKPYDPNDFSRLFLFCCCCQQHVELILMKHTYIYRTFMAETSRTKRSC